MTRRTFIKLLGILPFISTSEILNSKIFYPVVTPSKVFDNVTFVNLLNKRLRKMAEECFNKYPPLYKELYR